MGNSSQLQKEFETLNSFFYKAYIITTINSVKENSKVSFLEFCFLLEKVVSKRKISSKVGVVSQDLSKEK